MPFDAQSRGIAQVAVTIYTPPNQGLADHPPPRVSGRRPRLLLSAELRVRTITAAGPVVVPLSIMSEDDHRAARHAASTTS